MQQKHNETQEEMF